MTASQLNLTYFQHLLMKFADRIRTIDLRYAFCNVEDALTSFTRFVKRFKVQQKAELVIECLNNSTRDCLEALKPLKRVVLRTTAIKAQLSEELQ